MKKKVLKKHFGKRFKMMLRRLIKLGCVLLVCLAMASNAYSGSRSYSNPPPRESIIGPGPIPVSPGPIPEFTAPVAHISIPDTPKNLNLGLERINPDIISLAIASGGVHSQLVRLPDGKHLIVHEKSDRSVLKKIINLGPNYSKNVIFKDGDHIRIGPPEKRPITKAVNKEVVKVSHVKETEEFTGVVGGGRCF